MLGSGSKIQSLCERNPRGGTGAKVRNHIGQIVSDLQFFDSCHNKHVLLASVGYHVNNTGGSRGGNVVISRIYEGEATDIVAEQLLEIRSEMSCLTRAISHPSHTDQSG
jgi:hypothetical protein